MKVKNMAKNLLAAAAMAFTIAAVSASPVRAEGNQRIYTVEQGDNLCKISRKVYGTDRLWGIIYNANAGAVKHNYLIYKGQQLIIPAIDGGTNQAANNPAAAPATQIPAAQTPAAPAAQTPTAAQTQTPAAPAAQAQEYTLDYNEIASWVNGGFIGTDASGSPVVMAIDADNTYAIIIFGDNSDMTAVSFAGPIVYSGDYATITDEANGMSLTFAVAEVNDTTIALDMGDIGSATITVASKEDVLRTIKTAIENYRHVA